MLHYIDIHEIQGATPSAVAEAHFADIALQSKYGVEYLKYWFDESRGKVFCLCKAPSAEAADRVHREAHGLSAERIIKVDEELVESFLGGGGISTTGAALLPGSAYRDPGIRTILFTDIVDSTRFTQEVGDDAAMEMLRVHDSVVRNALVLAGGREIKHTGDGIMASFASAVAAVRCALRIQSELGRYTAEHSNFPLRVRIGGAAGEPVERDNDFFGSTVQLAARLCSQAEPQQILVSTAVAELCIGKGLQFQELGEVLLKGFDRPVRVHTIAAPLPGDLGPGQGPE